MGNLFNYPKFQAITSAGIPLVGGKLYSYAEGTDTAKATYSNEACTAPYANANPVVLDSLGEAVVYIPDSSYKFVLKTSAGVTVWTIDGIGEADSIAESELTIASGSITPTGDKHTVDTEADAATDELTNIVMTNTPDGSLLYLRAANDSRMVTITHAAGGVGQIHLKKDANLTLESTEDRILLVRNGTDWEEVFRSGLRNEYDNIWVGAAAMISTDTNGAAPGNNEYATNDINMDYLAFDGATEEYAEFDVPMPENWDRGLIKAKFYWAPGSSGCTAGDTVEWEIAAIATSNDDAIDTTVGGNQVISDVVLAGKDGDLHITGATPAITIAGTPALGDLSHFKVSRNVGGTDDMTEDAWLFGVSIQYRKTKIVAAW